MLEVCRTHIAISDNLEAMGLNQQKSVNVIQKQSQPHHGKKPQADSVHSCGHCTKSHPPGQSSCPAQEDKSQGCGKLRHWKPKCQSGHKGTQNKGHPHQGKGGKPKKISEVGTNDYHCDQVGVAIVLQAPSHSDTNTIHISDVQIDAATEAFATVEMPAEIGPCQHGTLKCKVDTGAGGNVMPLQAFAKLFPRCINADGSPRGLKPSTTCLTAYNGSKIDQFGTLDTAIDWAPKGKMLSTVYRHDDT